MHPYVYSSIIYNSKDTEAAQVSVKRWMDKENVIYNRILYNHNKDGFMSVATTLTDLEGILLGEISKAEKDKHHMMPFMKHKQNKKQNQTYKCIRQADGGQRTRG